MLIAREDIEKFCEVLRKGGKRVVFTNGCFDILHAGHVRYLEKARALNSDTSVRRLKGPARPVNREEDRAEVVGALKSVDYVTVFDEPTASELIALVKPAVYAKGGDYTLDTLPEAKIVQSYGGEVAFIDLVEGRSTTNIIEKIKEQ